jgi:hypothetical protein
MTPAVEIADFLAAQAVGTRGGNDDWSIHVGTEPSEPRNVVTLYDTGGPDPLLIGDGGEGVDAVDLRQPTIQVRVRAVDYTEAFEKHQQIFLILAHPLARVIGAHRYVGIWMAGEIQDIGRDTARLIRLTANYNVTRHETEGLS